MLANIVLVISTTFLFTQACGLKLRIFYTILFGLLVFLYRRYTFWARQGIPNEISSIYNRFLKPFHIVDRASIKKHGKLVGIYEGLQPCLLVSDPKIASDVLQQQFWNFPNHRKYYEEGQIGCQGLLMLNDKKWKTIRSIISPLFTAKSVRLMQNGIENSLIRMMENLKEETKNGSSDLDVKAYFSAFSLEAVAETVFGLQLNSLKNKDNLLVKHLRNLFSRNINWRGLVYFFLPWLPKFLNIYLINYNTLFFLHNFSKKLMDARKIELNQKNSEEFKLNKRKNLGKQKNFISLLLEAEYHDENGQVRKLNDNEIIDNSMLFFIAGFDTTAVTLSNIFYCMALYPDCQQRLYEELSAYVNSSQEESKIDERGLMNFEEINKLKYLTGVIWESMRFFPTVPRIERVAVKDCHIEFKGKKVFVPKDTIITISSWAINFDETLWSQVNEFQPERFCEETKMPDSISMEPKAFRGYYLPFAAGIRDCIGRIFAMTELKMATAHVLLNYEIQISPSTQIPLEYFIGQPVMTAKDIKLLFVPRTKKLN